MKEKLDPVYQDIIERFYRNRDWHGRIRTDYARRILSAIYHFAKNRVSSILNKMCELGLIQLTNSKHILIIWKPEGEWDLRHRNI